MLNRYGQDGLDLLSEWNPDWILRTRNSADECMFGDYPTLSELGARFDVRFPSAWLMAQLHDLSEYCGQRDKLGGTPLRQCASVMATEFSYLKVTELMLFFHRFKAGVYGRFYGSIDPLVIVTSLRQFLVAREAAYNRHEQEERMRQASERQEETMTWEEYCLKTFGKVRPIGRP